MGHKSEKPHILFFPLMAHGHMIPMIDIAKLFASRNLKTTILTTPVNEAAVSRQILKAKTSGFDINVLILPFPTMEAGLPEGCENLDFITSKHMGMDMMAKFFASLVLFQEPLEKILRDIGPGCLVADCSYPWATDSASKFGIPRLFFHGTSFFSLSTMMTIRQHKPHLKVSSDLEPFVVPNLPGAIKLTRNQMPATERGESNAEQIAELLLSSIESEVNSFGVIINSVYEIESAYADYYRTVLGRRAWHIGPVSLCNGDIEEKSRRGNETSIDEHECLEWLNGKEPNSVVYLCFGSVTHFKSPQLKEIATALEASGKDFVWVVRKPEGENEESFLEEFGERMGGKGLIILGWAPQVLILEHKAIGGFVTHCGWNSTLEGIAAGLPMATWPIGGEQFYNEKVVTEILKIGVSVGVEEWTMYGDIIVKSECIEKAINRIMEGEKAEEMRRKAKELGETARKAVEEGGSSYCDLEDLINELIKFFAS